jgi:hypothetical protein
MSAIIAELNYIVPTQERPRSFTYEPPDGSPRTTVVTAPHQLAIHDVREEDNASTLHGESFAVADAGQDRTAHPRVPQGIIR